MKDGKDLEREMIQVFARLPIPVVITRLDGGMSGHRYSWHCMEGNGRAVSFNAVVEQALHFLEGRLAGSALPGLCWFDWYPHK